MALRCLNDPNGAPTQEVALNNVFRLLESFRKNAFFGLEAPVGRRAPSPARKLTLRPPTEQHVRQVREALEHATTAAFADQSKDHAIEVVENVLRAIAYPARKNLVRPSKADLQRTAMFFREFAGKL
jgi:hypothetical protein